MSLIKRYIYDVTRRLPEKQRQDVARELQSEIETMVDDEAKGKVPTEKHIATVLRRVGDPALLASQYYEQKRYLISPRYYDAYISLLKTLLTVTLPIIAFFVLTLQLSAGHKPLGEAAISAAGAVFEVGIHIIFWTTLSLVVIDRLLTAKDTAVRDWIPQQLPDVPQAYQISKREAFIGIAWSIFGMALLITQIPAIHEVVQGYTPLFFASEVRPWWLAGFVVIMACNAGVELLKLYLGGWTKVMVMAITVVNTLSALFFAALLTLVQPIANPDFTSRIQEATKGTGVAEVTESGIRIIGLVIISVLIGEIIGAWMKYNKGRKGNI